MNHKKDLDISEGKSTEKKVISAPFLFISQNRRGGRVV